MEGEMHLTAQCEPALSAWLDTLTASPWHPMYDPRE